MCSDSWPISRLKINTPTAEAIVKMNLVDGNDDFKTMISKMCWLFWELFWSSLFRWVMTFWICLLMLHRKVTLCVVCCINTILHKYCSCIHKAFSYGITDSILIQRGIRSYFIESQKKCACHFKGENASFTGLCKICFICTWLSYYFHYCHLKISILVSLPT